MPIGEICNREAVIVHRNDSVIDAAKIMRKHHVGDVLVVDEINNLRVPVGIVTDRDLVVEIMAAGLDGSVITVGDIMPQKLVTVKDDAGVFEAIQYMRGMGVRRLPVVADDGGLVGIVTLDDLLELLSEEMFGLSRLVKNEQKKESALRQ